jgi:hypothetical protein
VDWGCDSEVDGAPDAHVPLWKKKEKEKHMLETHFNHHTSGFELLNCNNTIRWLIRTFLATLKTRITPAWHTARIVGSDMELIMSCVSSAFSLLGRQTERCFPWILESPRAVTLLSQPCRLLERGTVEPTSWGKAGSNLLKLWLL